VKKFAKYLIFGGLIAALALILAVVLAPLLINPNQYKTEIADFIKNKSGRDVAIEGDINLTITPWLGVKTGKIVVNNKSGFQNKTFATIDSSEIKLKTFPLLSGKVEVNAVELEGLTLNLLTNQQGQNNWDELMAAHPQVPSSTMVTQRNQDDANINESALTVITVGAISLKKGHITWENQQTGKTLDINNIEFATDKFVAGEQLNINLAADVSGNQCVIPGKIKVETGLRIDESLTSFIINNSKFEWAGKSLSSGQPITADIKLNETVINSKQQTLKSSGLQLEMGEIKLSADINGEQILDKPLLQGQIIIEPFNLAIAMQQWGIERPKAADAKAMTSFSLKSQYHLTGETVELKDLDVLLDDSHGKGSVAINNFDAPAVSFDLSIDAIDLDRYLPPRDKADISSPGLALAAGTISLPLDWLKKLDANGKLAVAKLKVNRMTIQDAHLTVSAKQGGINVGQTAKQFYRGEYPSNLAANVNAAIPQLTLSETLTNVQLEPYLQDIKGKAKLGGLLTTTTTLKGEGNNAKALRSNLKGQVNFFLKDGFIQGFNLERLIEQAKNAIKGGNKATGGELPNQTAFNVIKGTIAINNGRLNNNDLIINTATFRSKGEGNAVLETGQLDYKMTTKLLKAKATADSPQQFHSTPIVIHVGGTFSQPDFTLDTDALLTDKNKAKLESLLDHNKDKIDKLINKLDKKSGSNVKNLLKKIF
jgi:AsmA protein